MSLNAVEPTCHNQSVPISQKVPPDPGSPWEKGGIWRALLVAQRAHRAQKAVNIYSAALNKIFFNPAQTEIARKCPKSC